MEELLKIVGIILLTLTPLAYIPHYYGVLRLRATPGISLSAAGVNAMIAQAQVATMLFMWQHSSNYNDDRPISRTPSSLDRLNLAQLIVQLACSELYLLIVSIFPPDNSPWERSLHHRKAQLIFFLLLMHAALFFITLPINSLQETAIDKAIISINNTIANPLWTLLSVIAVASQLRSVLHVPRGFKPALNYTGLAMQIAVFILLAIFWPLRFQISDEQASQDTYGFTWYAYVGWACINSDIFALGQAAALVALLCQRDDGINLQGDDEHQLTWMARFETVWSLRRLARQEVLLA